MSWDSMHWLAFTIGVALVSSTASAQTISLRVGEFSEFNNQVASADAAVPQSAPEGPGSQGATVMVSNPAPASGVLSGELAKLSAFPQLYVAGLRSGDARICLNIVSADGAYSARGVAVVTPQAASAGTVRLAFNTANSTLSSQPAAEIAALARVVPAQQPCFSAQANAPILVAAWGSPPVPGTPVHVLISDAGETRPLQLIGEQSDHAAPCFPIPHLVGGVRYRQQCSVIVTVDSRCSSVKYTLETAGASVEKKGDLFIRPNCRGR
jgi:hypothetical protein